MRWKLGGKMKLFIDTCTNKVNITLFDQKIEKTFVYTGNNDHTLTVYKCLAQIDLQQVREIYVCNGPGSYTGVRIGVLVAKTLAHELNANLYAINTLALHYLVNKKEVGLDARGQKAFTYDGTSYKLKPISEVETLITNGFDSNNLLNPSILKGFKLVLANELKIEYMKDAI